MFAGVPLAFGLVAQVFAVLLPLAVFRHLVLHPHDCIRLDGTDMTYTYILPHLGSMCQDTYTFQCGESDAYPALYVRALPAALAYALARVPLPVMRMTDLLRVPYLCPFILGWVIAHYSRIYGGCLLITRHANYSLD